MPGELKARRIDTGVERQILTGMITDEKVLREISNFYRKELMRTSFGRIISGWCIDYWKKYEKAPGKDIQDIYQSALSKGDIDSATSDMMEEFLARLSKEYEQGKSLNSNFILDKTERYFQESNYKLLVSNISDALTRDQLREAEEALLNFRRVERQVSAGVDPLAAKDTIFDAFELEKEELFRLPGSLGRLIGPFSRGELAALMGPEKRGKSWWLIELTMRARRAGLNVVFFAVGDMTIAEMTLRFHAYLAQRSWDKRYCGEILIPILDCFHNQIDSCTLSSREGQGKVLDRDDEGAWILTPFKDADSSYRPCTSCRKSVRKRRRWKGAVWYKQREAVEPLPWQRAYREGLKFSKSMGGRLHLEFYPNNTVNMTELRSRLSWLDEQEGFVPDVVIIDYADILAPVDPRKEFRHQQNETWQEMRRMSQEIHCCVITATQTDARAYESTNVTERNFSEDKRKYAHVNKGIITLNQTPAEKAAQVMRIGRMFVREERYDINQKVTVLQCLEIGRPNLGSFFPKSKERR